MAICGDRKGSGEHKPVSVLMRKVHVLTQTISDVRPQKGRRHLRTRSDLHLTTVQHRFCNSHMRNFVNVFTHFVTLVWFYVNDL